MTYVTVNTHQSINRREEKNGEFLVTE